MANPFYSAMSGSAGNMSQMLQQLKANPVQFLMRRRFNIPANIANDPNAILQHIVSTGQASQQQINNSYQMAGRFRR